jgi:hypothetical protein
VQKLRDRLGNCAQFLGILEAKATLTTAPESGKRGEKSMIAPASGHSRNGQEG